MENGKVSEARKRSTDPAQEHLRAQKEIWSESTSELISKLIAFKRAVNGRGDPVAGLPPTPITEPFPAPIGSYLQHLANEYISVIQGAENIMQEQENYSQVRRKRQERRQAPQIPQQTPPMAADDGFVAEASWMGSRFWAKHFGLRGENKPFLKSIINSGDLLIHSLENIEDKLSTNDPNAAFYAFNYLVRVANSAAKNMVVQMGDLVAKGDPMPLPSSATSPAPKEIAPPELRTEIPREFQPQESQQTQESPVTPGSEEIPSVQSTKAPAVSAEDEVIAQYMAIVEDVSYMEPVLAYVIHSLPQGEQKAAAKKINGLESKIRPGNKLALSIKKMQEGKLRVAQKHLVLADLNSMFTAYGNLRAICSKMLGKDFGSFAEVIASLPMKKSQDDSNDAKSPMTWFRKKWMEHKLDFLRTSRELDEVKIVAVRQSESCQKILDQYLDMVETSGKPVRDLKKTFDLFRTAFSEFIKAMESVARVHNTLVAEERSNKKHKDVIMHMIPEESITKLIMLDKSILNPPVLAAGLLDGE